MFQNAWYPQGCRSRWWQTVKGVVTRGDRCSLRLSKMVTSTVGCIRKFTFLTAGFSSDICSYFFPVFGWFSQSDQWRNEIIALTVSVDFGMGDLFFLFIFLTSSLGAKVQSSYCIAWTSLDGKRAMCLLLAKKIMSVKSPVGPLVERTHCPKFCYSSPPWWLNVLSCVGKRPCSFFKRNNRKLDWIDKFTCRTWGLGGTISTNKISMIFLNVCHSKNEESSISMVYESCRIARYLCGF